MALLKLPFSHGSAADAPVGHTEPCSQGRQTVELGRGWYVPPSHGVHSGAPNASLMVPGEHGVGETDPVAQAEPGGQDEHSD